MADASLTSEPEKLRHALEQIASNNWRDQSRARHVAREALSASPTPPIPMIAEAGERDRLKDAIWELLSHRGERPGRVLRGGQELWETWVPAFEAAMRYLPLHTPATLDNTAVEVEQLRALLRRAQSIIANTTPPDQRDGVTRRILADCSATLTAKTEKAE